MLNHKIMQLVEHFLFVLNIKSDHFSNAKNAHSLWVWSHSMKGKLSQRRRWLPWSPRDPYPARSQAPLALPGLDAKTIRFSQQYKAPGDSLVTWNVDLSFASTHFPSMSPWVLMSEESLRPKTEASKVAIVWEKVECGAGGREKQIAGTQHLRRNLTSGKCRDWADL